MIHQGEGRTHLTFKHEKALSRVYQLDCENSTNELSPAHRTPQKEFR